MIARRGGPLVVVGDALLDRDLDGRVERLSPDAPVPVLEDVAARARPGGAALAAVLAVGDGHPVTLVTALSNDEGARELRGLLLGAGVEVVDLGLDGATPEKVRLRAAGRTLLRLDRGGRGGAVGPAGRAVAAALRCAEAVLVADYGRGITREPALRRLLEEVARAVPLVWDPHPRGAEPVAGARLVTPNADEAATFAADVEGGGEPAAASGHRAVALAERWDARAVCVTLGARGAVLAERGAAPRALSAPAAPGGDSCGAGDRFAARATSSLAAGAGGERAVTDAVGAASAFVAAGGAAAAPMRPSRPGRRFRAGAGPADPVGRTRASGGTVVATGGCFDLLHAGHVATLEAARELGDCLVVLLNSDESVRRLKGADRPLVEEADRAAVLEALRCVDAVVVFEEDGPDASLERLRPDIWVKGGDYDASELPEAEVVARHGGRTVILPYVAGRSTTRLIEEAMARGA